MLALRNGSEVMTNSQEKRVSRFAQSRGYRLEKVGKGPHHGRFAIVLVAEGSRVASGIPGAEFSFSLQEAEEWLTKGGRPASYRRAAHGCGAQARRSRGGLGRNSRSGAPEPVLKNVDDEMKPNRPSCFSNLNPRSKK